LSFASKVPKSLFGYPSGQDMFVLANLPVFSLWGVQFASNNVERTQVKILDDVILK
jgi:hypothetical protein